MRRIISFLLFFVSLALVLPISSCGKKTAKNTCTLNLTYDENNGIISGKAAYKFVNASNGVLNELLFNLYPNVFDGKNDVFSPEKKAGIFYAGETFGNIKISSVTSGGMPLTFSFSEDDLLLKVAADKIYPDDETEIEIEFSTTLPKANNRLGITENVVNAADFYPTLCKITDSGFVCPEYCGTGDPFYADCADFSVSINLPSVFSAACSGEATKTVIDGERTNYSFEIENGRYFALAFSDKFNVSAIKSGDTDIYYYSASGDEERLDEVKKCFEFYVKSFGAYPYKTFSVVETGLDALGTEFSGMCFINEKAEADKKLRAALHETAHEWWGITVGTDQINEAFIDEGLAEYSVYLYYLLNDKTEQAEQMINTAKAAYKSFFEINSIFAGKANTAMNRPLSSFKSEAEYVAIAYDKSLIMFAELEKTVGAKKNVSHMKKLYSDNKSGICTATELIKAFGRKEYFDSFITGKVIV